MHYDTISSHRLHASARVGRAFVLAFGSAGLVRGTSRIVTPGRDDPARLERALANLRGTIGNHDDRRAAPADRVRQVGADEGENGRLAALDRLVARPRHELIDEQGR